jgi:hypothetical protein
MEIIYITDDDKRSDYVNCASYSEPLYHSNLLCLVCLTDEESVSNQKRPWHRYRLKCGHVFHTRCLKRWCGYKNRLNCSYCGDIPEIITSRYCAYCCSWGHSCLHGDACDMLDKSIDALE